MRFSTWEPVYRAILDDFDYPEADDERARDVLADLIGPFDNARLDVLADATVAVCGAAPTLDAELDRAESADVVVTASTAADVCRGAGIDVDLVVTDLDGNPQTAGDLTREGIPVAVHAHGHNAQAIREHVPTFDAEQVLPTTQARPEGPVENFGGFTDGDRAAFLADHFGAAELVFPGWDFDDPSVSATKHRKLAWAERLLYWLEHGRDEQFTVLDGRRESIDVSALPIE